MSKILDRLMFGKKYIKAKRKKDREKILKRCYYILVGAFFLMFISFLIVFFQVFSFSELGDYSDNLETNKDVLELSNITYDGLNEKEISFFEEVFSGINPIYLVEQQKIIVVKNISKYCDDCSGINFGNGREIVILFRENENSLKVTISHEFMHTYLLKDGGDTPRHKIIYSLGKQKVAF